MNSQVSITLTNHDMAKLEKMEGETDSEKIRAMLDSFDADQVIARFMGMKMSKRKPVRIGLDTAIKLQDLADRLDTDAAKVARIIVELNLHKQV